MQIMFGTILCVILKGLILTKATITPKDDNTSNILQEESTSMHPDLNFTQDISMSEKNNHHILNFKSDRSHSDSIVRNEREVDEVTHANISIILESIASQFLMFGNKKESLGAKSESLSKPTSLRAFVYFDNQFIEKVNEIFVILRWNQPKFTDEIIKGYTLQCFFIEDLKEIQICDDKNITTTKLQHTVHNLKPNTTYYFRVRAHTKIVASPYTDLINVSTIHENPIPMLLFTTGKDIQIWDVDLNITHVILSYNKKSVINVVYSMQDRRIYWSTLERDLMTQKFHENNIIKIATFDHDLHALCIDWIARNLYWTYSKSNYYYIVKFDLTLWENGMIKLDEIFKSEIDNGYLSISPFMGILYHISYNRKNGEYDMMKYHLDEKNEQTVQINASFCLFHYIDSFLDIIIDNTNNEEPLIYWLSENYTTVTDINVSMCNTILHKKNVGDNINFKSLTFDKTNIYILANDSSQYILYVLKKKYANLKSVNADEYVEKKLISSDKNDFYSINAFDKSLQPYPPMRCLTPYEKVYNFENVTATANSIIVNLPEPVVKSGCKKYNLPTTIYTISCLNNNLNKSEKFSVQTSERYYEIQDFISFTEYKLQFTLSNFYFDQLSINPFDSNVIRIKTNSSKLSAPENISVLALTPTIAAVHWMPPKKLNCVPVTYEVHWKLVNDTQQESKQFTNVSKRMTDGRFFTKINLSLPVQDYLIYVRVYPVNFSDFYNESLNKIVDIYSEPNNITLYGHGADYMYISWISNVNLTVFTTLEYKEVATEKWQATTHTMYYKNKKILNYVNDLQPGTSYKFRLILRYPEYEENFTWPADERFIFSTRDNRPTSLRAFVQFDSQFTEKVNDIFVTLRWNKPEFLEYFDTIYGYTVQRCFIDNNLKEIQICDDKNITTTTLEHMVHNLKPNTTCYFRVRAYTKNIAGPYSDLINVSTTHENPIPKLLLITGFGIHIWDMDSNTINNLVEQLDIKYVAYCAQEHKIYWIAEKDLMTLEITKNNPTKIVTLNYVINDLCIDWVARNLYWIYSESDYYYIVKFDLTMWEENGILKYDKIFQAKADIYYTFPIHLIVSPSMGILYYTSYNSTNENYDIIKYHLDGKNMQIVQMNSSFCQFRFWSPILQIIIDDMNNEEPLIYWIDGYNIKITNTNLSTCNMFLHKENDDITYEFMTINKTNTYILAYNWTQQTSHIYVSKKKHVSLKSENINEYKEIIIPEKYAVTKINNIYVFDKYLQPYPPMRCLTPYEKVYNFENVTPTANSIIVNLPEPVVKSGCNKYNLPTTIYNISYSCLDNNLDKSEKFNNQTFERYYVIRNLTPCTELQFTLSNFYFDQLSIKPFHSNVIKIYSGSAIGDNSSIYAYYCLLILSFIVITCVCIYYWYRQRRDNNEQLLSSTMTHIELGILPCQYSQINPIYSSMLHYNPDECAITKIARKQIIFTKIIGSGAFGMVYQGKVKNLEGSDTDVSVALKTLRKDASSHEKNKLLNEAKLMNRFQHKHILRLLGVCLDGISPFLVLELMETGDLSKYLRDCRNLEASDSHALRLQDLFAMCEDVARGCCYLEELHSVHRDLACRNCLVSSRNREDRVIKIGDFGLARNIYENDYYRMRGEGLLPIRWMAPESLMSNIFTSQSDVWSFGVLMWEITSLGEQPYSSKANEEVRNYVCAGGRLPKSLNCPSALYQLLQRCWSGSAAARPSFKFCLKNIITLRENIEDALLSPVDTI